MPAKEAQRQFGELLNLNERFGDVFIVHEMVVFAQAFRTEIIHDRILRCITHNRPHNLNTRISRLEAAPTVSAFKIILGRISGIDSTIHFLELYRKENSFAPKEFCEYNQEFIGVRDKFLQVINNMLEEYRGALI